MGLRCPSQVFPDGGQDFVVTACSGGVGLLTVVGLQYEIGGGEQDFLYLGVLPHFRARGSSASSGYFIICQKPSRLAYFLPWNVNGVAAKLDSKPSSVRLVRMTSPGPASCGSISHEAACSRGTGFHHAAG